MQLSVCCAPAHRPVLVDRRLARRLSSIIVRAAVARRRRTAAGRSIFYLSAYMSGDDGEDARKLIAHILTHAAWAHTITDCILFDGGP